MSGPERMQRSSMTTISTAMAGGVMFSERDRKSANGGRFSPGNPRNGVRWRGKIPIPKHAHPLVVRLFQEMNAQHTTIVEVAERAGVCRQMIWRWGTVRGPKLDAIEACFNVLGLRLEVGVMPE